MAIKDPHKMIEAWLGQFNLTPKELLKLIESAETLDQTVPVNQAITQGIALLEKNGLPKTQLQAKYTLFLVELQASYASGEETLSEHGRTALESQGWSESSREILGTEDGIDTPVYHEFSEEWLAQLLREKEVAHLYVRCTSEKVENTPKMRAAAKSPGYRLKLDTRGQHILFRLINLAETFPEYDLDVTLRCDAGFFSDVANRGAVHLFLNLYEQVGKGTLASVRDFFPNDISGADELILRFVSSGNATDQTEVVVEDHGVIWSRGQDLREQVKAWGKSQPTSSEHVVEHDEVLKPEAGAGFEEAVAYVNMNGVSVLEPLPRASLDTVPVLKSMENVDKLIALVALEGIPAVADRFGGSVPGVLDGVPGYNGFVANCLPLFLAGSTSRLKDMGMGPNRTRIYTNFTPDTSEYKGLVSKYSHLTDLEGASLLEFAADIWEEEGKSLYEFAQIQKGEEDGADFLEHLEDLVHKAETHLVKEYMGYLIG